MKKNILKRRSPEVSYSQLQEIYAKIVIKNTTENTTDPSPVPPPSHDTQPPAKKIKTQHSPPITAPLSGVGSIPRRNESQGSSREPHHNHNSSHDYSGHHNGSSHTNNSSHNHASYSHHHSHSGYHPPTPSGPKGSYESSNYRSGSYSRH